MQFSNPAGLTVGLLLIPLLFTGCRPASESAQFAVSSTVDKLEPELATQVKAAVVEQCGTTSSPRMLGEPERDRYDLKAAQALYAKHCLQCHGVTGDGEGPAGKYLYPRPRDYRRGVFKFTTTPYGARARHADLMRTVTRGIPGTSMPSFRLLPKREREALIDYVMLLTLRGEFENWLAGEADFEEKVDPELIPDYIQTVLENWETAQLQEVHPLTPQPAEFTQEHVRLGKAAFLTKGCSKCHGDDGRGMTRDNLGTDTWGYATKAADLTSGLLHGGSGPADIYQRIFSGINGTPMPGFKSSLAAEPETIWNLVAYVLYVSNQRRSGTMPEPALFSLVTPESGKAPGKADE